MVDGSRVDRNLDCAAAVIGDAGGRGLILGIGQLAAPIAPTVGMRVIKSGAETGVTEGIIARVEGIEVTIASSNFPVDYRLSGPSDSGAVWIDAQTHSPVAMHYAGDPQNSGRQAFGRSLIAILVTLRLHPLLE
jgi:hypothetical protein